MSLIEEALRKQERDGGRRLPLQPPPPPASSADWRLSPAEPPPRRVPKLLLAGGALLLLATLGLVILPALFLAPRAAVMEPASASVASHPRPITGAATSTTARVMPVAVPLLAAVPATNAVATLHAPDMPVPTNTPPALHEPATNAPPPAATNRLAIATNTPPPVIWPALVYKGVFSANGQTQAVFNGDLTLEIGAMSPAGVTLLDVEDHAARVRYKGEERIYRRGGGILTGSTNQP